MDIASIRRLVQDIPDFPEPGILFRDITPVLAQPRAFRATLDHLLAVVAPYHPAGIVAIESRGFIIGAALAAQLELPLLLARKPGKLPRKTQRAAYALEYGSDALEMHVEDTSPGARYAVVDDLIATGGTCRATIDLLRARGAEVAVAAFFIELAGLGGRKCLDAPVESLLLYN